MSNQGNVASPASSPVTLDKIKGNIAHEIAKREVEEQPSLFNAAVSFSIGAAASAIGATAVYPIDLVKTRLQNQRTLLGKRGMSMWGCFTSVLRYEGPLGLYKGLVPQLVGQVPEKAIRLFIVDRVRNLSPTDGVSYPIEVLAGLAAGANQVLITNPAEIIKVRMQVQGHELAKKKAEGATVQPKRALSMLRELGFAGMYKGASACFLRDVPFSGIYFGSYAWMKEELRTGNEPLHSIELFFCASAAGVAAASLTTPADVLKTRMQVEAKKGEGYSSLRDCYRKVVTTEGYRALWKGVIPRVLRSSPQYGVMLFSYEILQRLFYDEVRSSISLDMLEDKKWVKMLLLEDKMGILLENSWVPPSSFTRFKGGFKHISVGGEHFVWAISMNDDIFRWRDNQWENTPGAKLKQLSAAEDGAVWGVNAEGQVYRWDKANQMWCNVPSPFRILHVAVGSDRDVWAIIDDEKENPLGATSLVDTKSNVVSWDGKGWVRMPGSERMKLVSCGADGALWAINSERFTFCLDRESKEWNQMPGSFKQVSVGSKKHVWGVDSKDCIYKWKKGTWQRVTVSEVSQHISVASDGSIVAMDKDSDGAVDGNLKKLDYSVLPGADKESEIH